MKTKKLAAAYSIFIGISMIGMWSMFYLMEEIPELITKPAEIGMHIAAELLTAIMLIAGGIGVLLNKKWGLNLYLISTGMLIYTLINSPGYYIQQGEIGFIVMFAIFFIFAILFLTLMISHKSLYSKNYRQNI